MQGKGFAGTVNLILALDNSIIVDENVPGAAPKIHRATTLA
jgi:hypothetical protein